MLPQAKRGLSFWTPLKRLGLNTPPPPHTHTHSPPPPLPPLTPWEMTGRDSWDAGKMMQLPVRGFLIQNCLPRLYLHRFPTYANCLLLVIETIEQRRAGGGFSWSCGRAILGFWYHISGTTVDNLTHPVKSTDSYFVLVVPTSDNFWNVIGHAHLRISWLVLQGVSLSVLREVAMNDAFLSRQLVYCQRTFR